jgi:membrane-associated phospholipid phosphatase
MTYSKRFTLMAAAFAVFCLYFPVNQIMSGGYNLKTTLDAFIPIIPVFAIPYLLCFPFWVASFVYAAWKMEISLYRSFIIGSIAAISIATLFFIFLPTYTDRPLLTGNSWAVSLLHTIYNHDNVNNAFPSNHVLITTLIALFGARWKPRLTGILGGTVILVILSTLFTGQHHLVDPLGGLALGWCGYQFGLWMESKPYETARGIQPQAESIVWARYYDRVSIPVDQRNDNPSKHIGR